MRRKYNIFLIILLFVIGLPVVLATTLNTPATKDTFLSLDNPNTNYGSSGVLDTDNNVTYTEITLIDFGGMTAIPAGSVINSASVNIYAQAGDAGYTQTLYEALCNWPENTITWNNGRTDCGQGYGALYNPSSPKSSATGISGGGIESWDVTSWMQSRVNSDFSNQNGIVITETSTGNTNPLSFFASRESGSYTHPYLLVDYTPPPTVPSVSADPTSYRYTQGYSVSVSGSSDPNGYDITYYGGGSFTATAPNSYSPGGYACNIYACSSTATASVTWNNIPPAMVGKAITPTIAYTTSTLTSTTHTCTAGYTCTYAYLWFKDGASLGITTSTLSPPLVANSVYKVMITPSDSWSPDSWSSGSPTYSNEVTIIGNVPANITGLTANVYGYNVDYSWTGGSNIDSFNVSYNNTWINGSSQNYINKSVGYRGYGNIIVYGYNITSNILGISATANTSVPTYIPPTPIMVSVTTGNFWINTSWVSGSGNITDSYNSTNGTTWINSTSTYRNTTLCAHCWQNLSVYAYNVTYGSLSLLNSTNNTQISNNPVVISNISSLYTVQTNATLSIYPIGTDADNDILIWGRDFANGTFYTNNGTLNWTTTIADIGTHNLHINTTDNNGSVYTQSFSVSIGSSTPSVIINLTNTSGNFYVNYSWEYGLNTDLFNVSQNNTWTNGTTNTSINNTIAAHGCSNISVYGYNITSSLLGGVSTSNLCLPNNAPTTPDNATMSSISFTTSGFSTITITNVSDLDGDMINSVFVGVTIFGNEQTYLMTQINNNTWRYTYSTLSPGTYSITHLYVSDPYVTTVKSQNIQFTVTTPVIISSSGGGGGGGGSPAPAATSSYTPSANKTVTVIVPAGASLTEQDNINKCITEGFLLPNECTNTAVIVLQQSTNWYTVLGAVLGAIFAIWSMNLVVPRKRSYLNGIIYSILIIIITLLLNLVGFNAVFLFNFLFNNSLSAYTFFSFTLYGFAGTVVLDEFLFPSDLQNKKYRMINL